MSAIVGSMSPAMISAIREYILQQTGKTVTISNADYSFFNDRIHFIVDGKGNYRLNIKKGTISRPSHVGYSRVRRCNDISSGADKLEVIKNLLPL